ncbi:RNA-binding protein [Candidatus Dependentiae bacterium]|nr:RNA-binding protein [Candidatus Dependentiae bacterium]
MNIYVGNLAVDLKEEELTKLFEEYGAVESTSIIKDKFTGQSRGFGFITMNDAEGEDAIANLNGKSLNGNIIKVNKARPRTNRGRNNFGGGGDGQRRGGFGGGFGGRKRF